MKHLLVAGVLAVSLGSAAVADPNPQLVQSVQTRLLHYGFNVDVSQFATNTVARLHLTLVSSDGYLKKKRELRSILRKPTYK